MRTDAIYFPAWARARTNLEVISKRPFEHAASARFAA
jgi:hypothetical protein